MGSAAAASEAEGFMEAVALVVAVDSAGEDFTLAVVLEGAVAALVAEDWAAAE